MTGEYTKLKNRTKESERKVLNKSRAERRQQKCPYCGITYRKFRMSVSINEVKELLKAEINEGKRVRMTRYTILGKAYEFKQVEWEQQLVEIIYQHI